MYSAEWFETYIGTRPPESTELEAITALIPVAEYPRVLDVGCGVGRVAGPLAARGYAVTGIDVSFGALSIAAHRAPGPQYLALDQRHAGRMQWRFDAVLVLWNSFGFADRSVDCETIAGLAAILRPGGKVLFDMYHPDWMRDHQLSGEPDSRGAAAVRRWVHGTRCFHEIRYRSGTTDEIQFELFMPCELQDLARAVGLVPANAMTWWRAEKPPSRDIGRYQLVCTKLSDVPCRESA